MSGIIAALAGSQGLLTASISPAAVTGVGSGTPVVSDPAGVTATGGSGGYTYAWSVTTTLTDGGAIVANSSTSATSTFQASLPAAGQAVGTAYCTVTDSAGNTDVTDTIDITLDRN